MEGEIVMNAREATNGYRLADWARVLEGRIPGESVDEFCERNRISRNQFFYWQRKLRETACIAMEVRRDCAAPQGWIVCDVPSEKPVEIKKQSKAKPLMIKIGQFSVPVSGDFDENALKKICGVLSELC